jgi:hypothetical protein
MLQTIIFIITIIQGWYSGPIVALIIVGPVPLRTTKEATISFWRTPLHVYISEGRSGE